MSVNFRGTIHKDSHVSIAPGVERGSGPSSYVADEETEAPRDQVMAKRHSGERQSPSHQTHRLLRVEKWLRTSSRLCPKSQAVDGPLTTRTPSGAWSCRPQRSRQPLELLVNIYTVNCITFQQGQ